MPDNVDEARRWRRTARARLRMELAGVAFARRAGGTPEDYARHLWGSGAREWFGQGAATPETYLRREAEAFRILYPAVAFTCGPATATEAALTFVSGCLGGWGRDQWAVARSLGLRKGHVCRYCRESFRVWSRQLGLLALPEPQVDGTCILSVRLA